MIRCFRERFGRFVGTTAVLLALSMVLSLLPQQKASANVYASNAMAMGIDVSMYQGNIDWGSVAASGVRFAFVRIGTLNTGIDPYYHQNMVGANAVGIKTGVYIYSGATTFERAEQEAAMVLAAIDPYPISMPVVIDMETKAQQAMDPAALSAVANYFCAIIESAGYYPMVYANKWFFSNKLTGVVYDKWVAQYYDYCGIDDACFWQASCTGRIGGIGTNVDIDYQYKDYSNLIIANGFLARKGAVYFYENYKMKRSSFVSDGVSMYYVNEFGQRVENSFYAINGASYYFGQEGRMQVGLVDVAGQTYYFDAEGKQRTGLLTLADGYYYCDPATGALVRGWVSTDGQTMSYASKTGKLLVGLVPVGDKVYLFNEKAQVMTGMRGLVDGLRYFDPNQGGAMVKGWFSTADGTYYADDNGLLALGVRQVGENIYYFNETGKVLTGMQNLNHVIYYFDPTRGGALAKGWFSEDGVFRNYADPTTGAVAAGIVTIDGKQYFFDPANGCKLVGGDGVTPVTLGGAIFLIAPDGVLTLVQAPAVVPAAN